MSVPIRSRDYTPLTPEHISVWKERLKDIRIVLFDWDGTLNRDSLKHYVAKHDVISKFELDKKYGLTTIEFYKFTGINQKSLNGSQARKSGWQYIRERFPEINIIRRFFIYLYYELSYSWNSSKYDFLYLGSAEMLLNLKKKGYLLGVATNKGSGIVRKQVHPSGIKNVFSSILGSNNVHSMKPNPAMFHKNLRIINRKSRRKYTMKNVLMVGDSIKDDVFGGLRAGAWTCLVHNNLNKTLLDLPENQVPHLNLKKISDLNEFLPSLK